ncbi:MAG: 23S rRNA (guanosine(2251)-2'-O)-methyltransferase RlmB [Alphaproteobacteria bacterium]
MCRCTSLENRLMKPNRPRQHPKQADPAFRNRRQASAGLVRIYGIHAAKAALANPRRNIRAIHATANAAQGLAELRRGKGPAIHTVTPKDLDRILGETTVHQGILVEADPLPEPDMDALGNARLVLVLDQITDPHNVGAILRSAAAFGVEALVMTARHSPPLNGTLAKTACGGLEHVPVVLPPNLARALHALGEMGFTRVGLDSGGGAAFEDVSAPERLALVLGAEDRGLRRLTAENCDMICALTTCGAIQSLNVSNAAAIALHSTAMKRKGCPGD